MAVSPEDFLTIHCRFPEYNEQEKISKFLRLIDQRIAKQTEYVEHLKKYKRGVSNKVFDVIHNCKSSKTLQFADVFIPLQNNTFSREWLTDNQTDILNIHYGDILIKYGAILDSCSDDISYIKPGVDISKFNNSSFLQEGDVIFADTAEDYIVGKMCEITNVSMKKILSGLHTMPFRPVMPFAPMYLGYYLNSAAYRTQMLPLIQGTKVFSISKSEIKKTILYVPSIYKQKQVVNILYTLDKRIRKVELLLDNLEIIKHGLLQQLFI